MKKTISLLLVILTFFGLFIFDWARYSPSYFDFSGYASLPVLHQGQVKSIGSVARYAQSKQLNHSFSQRIPPTQWFLGNYNSVLSQKDFQFHPIPVYQADFHPLSWESLDKDTVANKVLPNPFRILYKKLLSTYTSKNYEQFNHTIKTYDTLLKSQFPTIYLKARLESWLHHMSLTSKSVVFYTLALCFGFFIWLLQKNWLKYPSTLFVLTGFSLQSIHILFMLYISPKLYLSSFPSTFFTASWVFMGFILIADRLFRIPLGYFTSLLGSTLVLILGIYFHTIETELVPLSVELNSSLFLLSHVMSICIGYAALLFGACLSHYQLFQQYRSVLLSKLIHGLLWAALLFCFLGTVAGSIWSYFLVGTYWSGSPKELSMALLLLWITITLYAAHRGIVRQKGIALMSIIALSLCLFTWLVISTLAISKHGYLTTSLSPLWPTIFILCEWIVVGIGLFLPVYQEDDTSPNLS